MVWKTVIRSDGHVPLGDAARCLGFVAGTPVEVIVTITGTLLVTIDDSPVLDVAFTPLTGRRGQRAMQHVMRNRRAP